MKKLFFEYHFADIALPNGTIRKNEKVRRNRMTGGFTWWHWIDCSSGQKWFPIRPDYAVSNFRHYCEKCERPL